MRPSLYSRPEEAPPAVRVGLPRGPVPIDSHPASHPSPHFSRVLHSAWDRPSLSREKKTREALLLIFCDPIPKECLRLWLLTNSEWRQALHWLDTSGLALYILDRLEQLDLCSILPTFVLARLRRNLADNTVRTAALMSEWAAMQRSFQSAGLSYATLKGFSLWPNSVPRPEFRSQLDFDFLVAENSAPEARRILEALNYRLRAIGGRSWEFITNHPGRWSLDDLYKATQHRVVELHLESATAPDPLLHRLDHRDFHGLRMPVLCPVDLFLGQALHLYKHISGQFTRTAHLIEFRRHVIARRHDLAFWRQLRALAERNRCKPIALGVVTLFIARLMGDFAPPAFTSWTVDRVPLPARLWIETYAHDSALADAPGSKLHLLLQQALDPSAVSAQRSIHQALIPRRLPIAIAVAHPTEGFVARILRNARQLRFVLSRVRFHLVEGLLYLRESRRFRKSLARVTES